MYPENGLSVRRILCKFLGTPCRYQFVVEVMTDMWSMKEIIQRATLGIPKKNAISIVFGLEFLSEMKISFSGKPKLTKTVLNNLACRVSYKPSKVGWLTQSKKSCQGQTLEYECSMIDCPSNSPYLQDYFRQFLVLRFLEFIFSFLIKMSMLKAIEIETAFFHSPGNPKGRMLDYFFYASHIHHNFPYKLIPISMN